MHPGAGCPHYAYMRNSLSNEVKTKKKTNLISSLNWTSPQPPHRNLLTLSGNAFDLRMQLIICRSYDNTRRQYRELKTLTERVSSLDFPFKPQLCSIVLCFKQHPV